MTATTVMTVVATALTATDTPAYNSSPCVNVCPIVYYPHVDVDYNSRPPKVTGSMVQVLEMLMDKFNMCYEWYFPESPLVGHQLPNGTWTGAVGALIRGECQMTGSPIPMNHMRYQAADFSIPLYMDPFVLAYVRPKIEADLVGFVKPFTSFIWLLLLVSVVAVVVGVFFIEWGQSLLLLRPQLSDSETGGGESRETVSLLNVVWSSCLWTVAAALAQGSSWSPKGDSVRLLSGLWLLIALIVGTVYRCNLKAMLIMPRIRYPFNSLEELMDTDVDVYMPEGSMAHHFVTIAPPGTVLQRVNERLITYVDPPRAVRDTLAGLHASVGTASIAAQILHDYFSVTNTCPLYVASEPVVPLSFAGLQYTKGSRLRAMFDPYFRNFLEMGILQQVFDEVLRNGSICLQPESFTRPNNSLRPLEVGDFYGVFAVYAGGILLASTVLLVEVALKGLPGQKGRQVHKSQP